MSSVARLYTPEILALAVDLAAVPLNPHHECQGHARSPSCGSTLDLSLALDKDGLITAVGARAQACAIGQASAALFVRGARGQTAGSLAAVRDALRIWLDDAGPRPDWPGLDLLDAARTFSARHGAILLPWNAALDALSSPANHR